MKFQISLFLVFCFALHSTLASKEPFNFYNTTRLKVGEPQFIEFTTDRPLALILNLTLTSSNSSSSFFLCLRRSLQPDSRPSIWNSRTCTIYVFLEAQSGVRRGDQPGRTFQRQINSTGLFPAQYYLGMAVINGSSSIKLSIDGFDCTPGSAGPDCETNTTAIDCTSHPCNFTFSSASQILYGDLPKIFYGAGKISFYIQSNSSSNVKFSLGYGNIPQITPNTTFNATDFNNTLIDLNREYVVPKGLYSLVYPSPVNQGSYIVALESVGKSSSFFLSRQRRRMESSTVSFWWNVTQCAPNTRGPNCQSVNVVKDFGATQTFKTPNGTWVYFAINSTNQTQSFSVSVQLVQNDGPAPQIYLRWFQIPKQDEYDAIAVGGKVNTIGVGRHQRGTWFLGILGTGHQYALWFNTPCPNKCSDHGTCEPTTPESTAFACQCTDDYELFDCSSGPGLKAVYIALILVAYLVVLSAGLVLMLWACHKRRTPPGDYQLVKE